MTCLFSITTDINAFVQAIMYNGTCGDQITVVDTIITNGICNAIDTITIDSHDSVVRVDPNGIFVVVDDVTCCIINFSNTRMICVIPYNRCDGRNGC